jgi:hypothetical protein
VIPVDQVSFAERATGEELNGIHRAHVGLDHCHHLLVGRVRTDLAQAHLGGPDAHCQPGAHVPMELDHLLNYILIYHLSSFG